MAWLFFTQGFQMASQSLIRMGISQSCDLAPELLNVVTSLIPTSQDIRLICIKTTSMPMVVVRFHILFLREPSLDGPHSQADSLGDLLDFHSLLAQCHHLLIAIIPFSFMSRVGPTIKRDEGQQGLL